MSIVSLQIGKGRCNFNPCNTHEYIVHLYPGPAYPRFRDPHYTKAYPIRSAHYNVVHRNVYVQSETMVSPDRLNTFAMSGFASKYRDDAVPMPLHRRT